MKSSISPTISARAREAAEGYTIRQLTPLECERLQGFPDNWTKYGSKDEPISDAQRYRAIGAAVTAPVVKAVGEQIRQYA